LLYRLFGIISRVSTDQETPKLVCRVIEAEISGAKVINPQVKYHNWNYPACL